MDYFNNYSSVTTKPICFLICSWKHYVQRLQNNQVSDYYSAQIMIFEWPQLNIYLLVQIKTGKLFF